MESTVHRRNKNENKVDDVTKSETRQSLNTFEHVCRRLIIYGILLSCLVVEGQKRIARLNVTNLVASLAVTKPWVVLLVVAFHALPVVSLPQL